MKKSSDKNKKQQKLQIGDIVNVSKLKQKSSFSSILQIFRPCQASQNQKKQQKKKQIKLESINEVNKRFEDKLNTKQQSKQQKKEQQENKLVNNYTVSTMSTTRNILDNSIIRYKQRLFQNYPEYDPSIYYSYLITPQLKQYVYSQCYNKLYRINPNYQFNTVFILDILSKHAYQIEYTHEVGTILSHLSSLAHYQSDKDFHSKQYLNIYQQHKMDKSSDKYRQNNPLFIVSKFINHFPQIIKTKFLNMSSNLKNKKLYLVNYALQCLSMHLGSACPQLKSLKIQYDSQTNNYSLFGSNNKWINLVIKLFQSLLFQYIPSQLTNCIIQLYFTQYKSNLYIQNSKYIYEDIRPYQNFFKLFISLFHYSFFMKKPISMESYFLIVSSPYMNMVQWPIIISNSHQFDLPIPKFINHQLKRKQPINQQYKLINNLSTKYNIQNKQLKLTNLNQQDQQSIQ